MGPGLGGSDAGFSAEQLEVIGQASVRALQKGREMGKFWKVDAHLIASVCMRCGCMAYLLEPRSGGDRTVGGSALEYSCVGDPGGDA
jgi:hypothetical protein